MMLNETEALQRGNSLLDFMKQHDGTNYMLSNVGPILKNLQNADADGCLDKFMMNQKPYKSDFPVLTQSGGRGKDQASIVFAMNLHGIYNHGFAQRINTVMKQFANGNAKQINNVRVLLATQLQLQELEISAINFVDRELADMINRDTRRKKGSMITLFIFLLFACSIALPGGAISGFFPLTLLAIPTFIYSLFSLFKWIGTPVFSQEVLDKSTRAVEDIIHIEDETSKIFQPKKRKCRACNQELPPEADFCGDCGTKQ